MLHRVSYFVVLNRVICKETIMDEISSEAVVLESFVSLTNPLYRMARSDVDNSR